MMLLMSVMTMLLLTDEKPGKPQASLEGTWVVVEMKFNGKAIGPTAESAKKNDRQLVFEKKQFTALVNGKKINTVLFELDTKMKPAHIDLRNKEGAKEAKGIFQLKEDRLELCYSEPGQDRPKTFASKEGDRHFYLVLKRKK